MATHHAAPRRGGARDVSAPATRTPLPEGRVGRGRGRGARPGRQAGRVKTCAPAARDWRHDLVSFRELLRPGLLPLLHHLQVQRPVSAGRPRGGGREPGRALTSRSCRSEYNAFWKCVQAGVTYLFVQLCKVRPPRSRGSCSQALQTQGSAPPRSPSVRPSAAPCVGTLQNTPRTQTLDLRRGLQATFT